MPEQSNKSGAETSSVGPSASLTIGESSPTSTPVHHSEASSTVTESTVSSISSSITTPTSSIVSSVSVRNSPDFAIPGTSEPQAEPSSDILQTALLLSGMGQDFLSEAVYQNQDPRGHVPDHKLSLLQEDLYLSDSDDEALDYELDLNADTSDNLIGITGSVSDHDDALSDTDDDSSDDDGSASDSESLSSDSSDYSSDEEDETDTSTDDGNSSDDEAESSSESDNELDDDEQRVRRTTLLRALDILTANSSFPHNFISLSLHEKILASGKRKRDDDGPGFSPKRIKLEEEMRSKRKRAHEEEHECGVHFKRRKLEESVPSTSNGIIHKRKRRALSHKDPYKYPPSIPKIQRLVSKDDQLFPNPCPRSCPCIAGCRVSSLRLRRIRRRYTVIQPLYKKLLNNRLLGPGNLSQQRCCEKLCCFRWFGKAIPQYALLDDYPQSDLSQEDYRLGSRKGGKGHLI